jgi:hypothetical protein
MIPRNRRSRVRRLLILFPSGLSPPVRMKWIALSSAAGMEVRHSLLRAEPDLEVDLGPLEHEGDRMTPVHHLIREDETSRTITEPIAS